ncbi:MAG: hypothetical protein AAF296_04420 [Pseudomonadota bacterium]
MKRQIKTLKTFPFERDFKPPKATENEPGQIVLTPDELAALISETRDSTAKLVRDETLSLHAREMKTRIQDLRSALERVSDLAAHLQTASLSEQDRLVALEKVRYLASTLVDGQADLFRDDEG